MSLNASSCVYFDRIVGGYRHHRRVGGYAAAFTVAAESLRLEFATASNRTYTVESAAELAAVDSAWTPVGEPVTGDDHLHSVTVPTSAAAGFFRLKVL